MRSVKFNLEALKKEGYLASLGDSYSFSFQFKGGSMYPILKDGDWVTIKYVEPKKMKIGDIIVYKRKEEVYITNHRLVKKASHNGRLYFITRGDATIGPCYDSPIYEEDILGMVISRKRGDKIMNFDSYSARITGYIFNHLLFYYPQILEPFLRKIVRVFQRLWKIVLRRP